MPGTPLWLQGYGYDLEDGMLGETALRWHTDRDGDLGTGSQRLVTLSPGRHHITLTATDSDGQTDVAGIEVFAGGKVYLPVTRARTVVNLVENSSGYSTYCGKRHNMRLQPTAYRVGCERLFVYPAAGESRVVRHQ